MYGMGCILLILVVMLCLVCIDWYEVVCDVKFWFIGVICFGVDFVIGCGYGLVDYCYDIVLVFGCLFIE